MTSRWRRLACALVVLTCGLAAPALAQETPAAEPAAEKPAPIQPISIESVPKRAQALSTNLGELTPTEASRSELDDLGAQLVRSRAAVDARLQQILASLESGPGVRALGPMESELLALQSELDSHSETLDKLLADVGAKIKQLDTAQGVWQATLALAQGEKASRTTLQLVRKTQTDIGKTRAALVGRRDEILSLADGLIQERASIVGGVKRVQTARDTRRKDLLAVNRPPIFSTRAFEARRRELASDWSQATADRRERVFRYARENAGVIGFQLVLLLGLALGMYVLRRGARSWAQEDYDLREPEQVLEMPISMALVITLALTPQLHPLAPALLTDLAYIFLVIPAARIVRRISPDVFAPLIVGLVVFYVVEQVREVLAVFPAIERVAFVAELAGAIVFLLWLIRPSKVAAVPRELLSQPVFRAVGMGVRVAIGLFAVALIAEMVGLSDLGDLVGGGAMAAALAGLFVYALLNVVRSLLAYLIVTWPLSKVRGLTRQRRLVRRNLDRMASWAALAYWAYLSLGAFALAATAISAVTAILSARLTLGALSISLGDVVLFALVVWLSFGLARLLNFVLNEDVFPRIHTGRGVPYAVSNLARYTVLFLGFVAALAAAGFELSKLTIIVGGLGVGIGFGLQNIFNNFMSGLILLFERPFQVGDALQIPEVWGEIKSIGIRASVIRGWDGTEVIVPNGRLISEPVTNWTLSDKRRRLEVTVGVEYGTPARKVIDLLVEVAAGHPGVLENPEPNALFLGFGDSSLDFSLRAWIADFDEGLTIRSDLHVAVQEALAEAGITVPFPQRDLHLQSVAPDAAERLSGSASDD
jgi:small-conductance mechanosensitive channel